MEGKDTLFWDLVIVEKSEEGNCSQLQLASVCVDSFIEFDIDVIMKPKREMTKIGRVPMDEQGD